MNNIHLFDCVTPKHPTAAEIAEERVAHSAFVARERAKKFIVRDDFGSSRFSTLEEAHKWAQENHSILSHPVIALINKGTSA
jgi:hypothetical protein